MKLKLTFLLTLTILLFSCKEEKKDNRNLFLGVAALASQAGSGQITATHKATARITDKATGAVIANATINFTHGNARNLTVTSTVTTDANGLFEFLMSGFVVTLRILKADGTAFTGEAIVTPNPAGGFPVVTYSDGIEFLLEFIGFQELNQTSTGGGGVGPGFSVANAGLVTEPTFLTITAPEGASIHYTLDGTDPTPNSPVYTEPLAVWALAGRTVKSISVQSGVASSVSTLNGVFSYPPLKTGAGAIPSYTLNANEDGTLQLGVTRGYTGPIQHSTFTSDYTTKDNATGLTWNSCPQGLSGANCATGTVRTMIWQETQTGEYGCGSLNTANSGSGYAGIKTWRVPTVIELLTLTTLERTSPPMINTAAFPSTASGNFWTNAQEVDDSNKGYAIAFNDGRLYSEWKTGAFNVRCVSGVGRANNPQNYTNNNDGTTKDNATGLIWQRCVRGQNQDAGCTGSYDRATWVNAISYCNTLNLAGKTWRLPNINEALSILDYSRTWPSVQTAFFPQTDEDTNTFWTSSTDSSNGVGSTVGAFALGITRPTKTVINKTITLDVRCVTGP